MGTNSTYLRGIRRLVSTVTRAGDEVQELCKLLKTYAKKLRSSPAPGVD